MFTVQQVDSHLIGLSHGGTLNKVRNKYQMYERAASKFLLKNKPSTSIRLGALSSTIHDDVYNYPLPSDFGQIIDLLPQDSRNSWDTVYRAYAGRFDLEKATKDKTVSIEGSEGTKIIRINWRSSTPQTVHTMDSLTANGTWSAVASATGLSATTLFKVSGSAAIEFNIVVTGDGIQNTTMDAVDLTDEDEIADFFVWIYFGTVPTSISARWGNDLTTNYWSSTAQTTQADGTALRVGWNLIKFPWSTATETGTVDPATIDSFRITVASSAQNNVRVDNITCSIGRNFDMKYYSKFLFRSSAGTWLSIPTSDDDSVVIDNDGLPLLLFELLKDMAHQMEGSDSAFDITYARQELEELYPHFRAENPNQSKKPITNYAPIPRWGTRR